MSKKPTCEPKLMPCTVHKIVEIKKIKDREHEDGRLFVKVDVGWVWMGMLIKDLYRGEEWHKLLFKIKPLYFAFYGGWNTTLRIDAWYKNEWHTAWDACNHFNSFSKDKKMGDAYNAAAKAYANAIFKCIKRHPVEAKEFLEKMKEAKKRKNRGANWPKEGKGQDLILAAIDVFEDKVADAEYKKILHKTGPSMFQAGWAFQEAYYRYKKNKKEVK